MHYGILTLEDYRQEAHGSIASLYGNIVGRAVEAERLGYHGFWLTEHHFHWHGGVHSAPLVLLSGVAQATERIRLGIAVVEMPFWDPLKIAEEYACLDQLSNGRVEFGAGRGFLKAEYDGWGISMSESRARFQENLEVLERAWSEERLSFQGQFHSYDQVLVVPQPAQRPHPPIWIAATITPESYTWIGQHGYPLMVVPYVQPSVDHLKENIGRYLDAYRAAGHSAEPRVYAFFMAAIGDDTDRLRDEIGPYMKNYGGSSTTANAAAGGERPKDQYGAFDVVGGVNRMGRDFDGMRERHSVLIGTPQYCIEELRYLQQQWSLTYTAIIPSFGGVPEARVRDTMRRFACEIIPAMENSPARA